MNGIWGGLTAGVVLLCGCVGSQPEPAPGADEGPLSPSLEVNVADAGVQLTLHVTNTSSRPVEFTFPSSQRYDFIVRRAGGEEVWRWSEGMMFTQAISRVTLAPDESWDMQAVWDASGLTGEFVATGVVTARDQRPEQTVRFELP